MTRSEEWLMRAMNARLMAASYRVMAGEGLSNEVRRDHLLRCAVMRDEDADFYEARGKAEAVLELGENQ